MNTVKPVRFNFTHDFVERIREFTQSHCDLPRHVFQSEWKAWIQSIEPEIHNQQNRLAKVGCLKSVDEIIIKMYKSARFYHKNKIESSDSSETASSSDSEDVKEKIKGFNKAFLRLMDEHIRQQIMDAYDEDSMLSTVTPSDAYRAFCQDCADEITEELIVLRKKHDSMVLDKTAIAAKLEKSYKNRFSKCKL